VPVLRVEDAGCRTVWAPWVRQGVGASVRAGLSLDCLRGSWQRPAYLSEHEGDARPETLIHLYVKDMTPCPRSSGFVSMRWGSLGGSATWWIRTATGCVCRHPALLTTNNG
jgi:hypothetical protein